MTPLPNQVPDRISRALGEAVVRIWSGLPQNVQHDIFEQAVASTAASEGPGTRIELATFLHGRHSRTSAGIRASAIPEPDSLGG